MKPIHIIAGIGAAAIVALVACIMYLSSAPLTGQSIRRGLSPELLGARKLPPPAAPTAPVAPKPPPAAAPAKP